MTTLSNQLEQMIDNHGLANVLEHIQYVCYEKAEHLRGNWQDENAARWESAAHVVGTCSTRKSVTSVTP